MWHGVVATRSQRDGGDAHEMMIMVIKHEEMNMEQSDQGKGIIIGFTFAGLR
jgi:hypothetical protein